MSCCPDRMGMRKNPNWKYYKTVKKVCVNAGYINHCVTQDTEVLRITNAVTEKTGKICWVECVNVHNISAQVVECDLKVYTKEAEKPANAITVKSRKKNCLGATKFKNWLVKYVDEDGDESEERLVGITKAEMLRRIEENRIRFGLTPISVNGKKGTFLSDDEARRTKEYIGEL